MLGFIELKISRNIYIPVKYDESLFNYFDKGQEDQIIIWHDATAQTIKHFLGYSNIKLIIRQCKMLTERIKIGLSILQVIPIDNEHFVIFRENLSCSFHCPAAEIYCRGVKLMDVYIEPSIKISGAEYGKCMVDISNKNITPNVARNRLSKDVSEMVTLAIERAALQYIVSNIADKKLQEALQAYINKNYSEDNPYTARRKM